ncbi:sigma 54-interacting transcriptional regulator [Nissabacter archeti]|uniref:Sigma 54-interacting transcriptional regulator n=1 Tax=Nissabacter archeti TaxID=1917880 RepID=A0ABS5JP03_9GAMM|nr:sigma-54-dependent transcriptional regulator [Nissabacter archeti]MBS0970968.1 sigma 54-interacting transcriptional regulator [Nissabacter archeti]
MRKDDLLTFLMNQTDFFNPADRSEVFTAAYLARRFGLQRNTASHYLNQCVAQGLLIKVNTRPVYFLHRQAFEQQFYPLSKPAYASMEELLADNQQPPAVHDHFALLIGYDGSLKKPIEQLKTALFYPDGGLPLLITGDSGTGKSYLAQLMHHYAISQALIEPDAPFITFNCAQYAHNPELLASNLFGYIKGAFTGAVTDKPGAFEAAHGGILFLDEVHRLHAEGQEKLFTWLDRGEIYRVGETARGHPVSVRLIFATTEEIHSTFLTTFIRRIPIQVVLPALESRGRKEKERLILQFFWLEAKKVARRLSLSPRLLSVMTHYVYRGNVGELKNSVKYAVASAFATQNSRDALRISIHDLPETLMAHIPALNDMPTGNAGDIVLDQETHQPWLLHHHDPLTLLIGDTQRTILTQFDGYRAGHTGWEACEKRIGHEIDMLFDRLVFDNRDRSHSQMLLLTTSQVRDEFYRLEKSYHIHFNGNGIYALAHYLTHCPHGAPPPAQVELCRQFTAWLGQKYPLLTLFGQEVLAAVARRLDIQTQPVDLVMLILWLNNLGVQNNALVTKAVILAHGYATASSIANVANRLLKQNVFESFDMPLDVTPEAIAQEVMAYLARNPLAASLMILVDMGSLTDIHRYFTHALTTPVAIINNVSTRMALYVGERILHGDPLEEIAAQVTGDLPIEQQIIWPCRNKPRAIITTCATGIGAATNLSTLLKASIPAELAIDVVAYEHDVLTDADRRAAIFSRFEVLAIVGTLDPQLPAIPYLSLETLIAGRGGDIVMGIFRGLVDPEGVAEINNLIIKNFSLRRVIESVTILDTGKVINQVEQFFMRYEHLTGMQIANDKKVALYIHISCLIERLIRQAAIQSWPVNREQCQRRYLIPLREAFSVIEGSYSVNIPDAELYYVHDILNSATEFIQYDQEF